MNNIIRPLLVLLALSVLAAACSEHLEGDQNYDPFTVTPDGEVGPPLPDVPDVTDTPEDTPEDIDDCADFEFVLEVVQGSAQISIDSGDEMLFEPGEALYWHQDDCGDASDMVRFEFVTETRTVFQVTKGDATTVDLLLSGSDAFCVTEADGSDRGFSIVVPPIRTHFHVAPHLEDSVLWDSVIWTADFWYYTPRPENMGGEGDLYHQKSEGDPGSGWVDLSCNN